jgi:hypothetical protein
MTRYVVTIEGDNGHDPHTVTVETAYPLAAKRDAIKSLPYRNRGNLRFTVTTDA